MNVSTGELLGEASLDFCEYGTQESPTLYALTMAHKDLSLHVLKVQLIGQEEVTDDVVESKRKEVLEAKDTQLREVFSYQEQIDKLQYHIDQIQAELASKRES